jgi:CRP-like cAMP-binding protein
LRRWRVNDWFPVPLQQNELFEVLTEGEISRLAPLCSHFAAVEDSVLFMEGRNATHLYLVTEGRVALQKSIRTPHARHPRRTTVTVCYPGEIVGWSALVRPYMYTLSAVAWEDSRLISMEAKMLRKVLVAYPEMGLKVMDALAAVMSKRLSQTTSALIIERELIIAGLKV